MLQADLEAFIASLSKKNREELIRTATDLFCECSKTKGSLLENTRITDEMGRLYRSLEEEVKELRAKVKELELQNQPSPGSGSFRRRTCSAAVRKRRKTS